LFQGGLSQLSRSELEEQAKLPSGLGQPLADLGERHLRGRTVKGVYFLCRGQDGPSTLLRDDASSSWAWKVKSRVPNCGVTYRGDGMKADFSQAGA